MNHKKKWLMFAVGLVVTVVALWYSTRQVVLKDFIGQLKSFDLIWIVPAWLIFIYSMYLRAVRWGLLFRPHHDLKGHQVFRPLIVCFGFNCILPGRVGEFARAWIVGTRQKTGVTTALATVVAERIIDAATLVGLLAYSLSVLPPMDPGLKLSQWGYEVSGAQFGRLSRNIVSASIVLVAGTIIFMLPLTQSILHALIRRLPISPKMKDRLRHLLIHFAQGFHALKQPWVMARILFHSVLLWVLVGVSNVMLAWGFHLNMNLAQATAQMVIIAIFITIPAAPGYWGLFEAGGIFGAIVLGITKDQSLALAYTLVMHLVQIVPLILLSLIFAWQLQMKPADAAEIGVQGEG